MIRSIIVAASAALAMACSSTIPPQTSGAPASASSVAMNQRMDSIAEAYFEATLPLAPQIATSMGDARYNASFTLGFVPETRRSRAALVRQFDELLRGTDRGAMDEEHRITWDVLHWTLDNARQEEGFAGHLLPLNQFFNFTASFMQMSAGTGLHPFRTVKDYDDFLSRIGGFGRVVDASVANMREGMQQGVVQPRTLVERTLPQLSAHVVADPSQSLAWGPITRMPAEFSREDRERLTAAYSAAIRDQLVPTFRRLHEFMRDEYLPKARATAGLSALPNGRAWYEYMVRTSTTTSLTPERVHAIGLAEVARIHGRMEGVMRQVGWQGDLTGFMRRMQTDSAQRYRTREEMLADYRAAQQRIDASTDRLFDVKPRAHYEIRAVEPFRERSASGGSYSAGTADGSRPGVFYLNTYDPQSRARYRMESLLIHEGSPGHHFQISLTREMSHLPRLRRFGGFTAYVEGWGLYSETLGRELGVYTDPYQYYGYLSAELWRAIRLVLDTGIHAQGWTLEQAMEYARRNSSESETTIRSEVERFAAIPGQALAYKIGQLKISELRQRAESALGPKFDIRAFHRVVLGSGALPLDVLEAKVDRWIRGARA
jgi:uncharacterized protein (DUF885 family)